MNVSFGSSERPLRQYSVEKAMPNQLGRKVEPKI